MYGGASGMEPIKPADSARDGSFHLGAFSVALAAGLFCALIFALVVSGATPSVATEDGDRPGEIQSSDLYVVDCCVCQS